MGDGLFSYDILDAELAKQKDDLMKEIKSLKNDNSSMQKTIDQQAKEISELKSTNFSMRKIEGMIEDKLNSMKNSFVRKNSFESHLNQSQDFKFVLNNLKEVESSSIRKRDFRKFDQDVSKLRRETATLKRLGKDVDKVSDIEKRMMKLERKAEQLHKKFDSYEVRKWK